jgi:hypothetical protein
MRCSVRDRRLVIALLSGATIGACAGPSAPSLLHPELFKVRVGDDPGWSDPSLDDSSWQRLLLHQVPGSDRVTWLRTEIDLEPRHIPQQRPVGLFFAALASHEIFWDGERVGQGGRVGRSRSEEIPGPIQARYFVPERLATPGRHVIAIRTSTFHRRFTPVVGYWTLSVGEYDALNHPSSTLALVSLSGFLIVGAFALVMFALDRRDRPFLLIGLICAAAAGMLLAESWRNLFGYTYDRHLLRLGIIAALAWALDLLLLLFLTRRFPLRGGRAIVVAGTIGATLALIVVPVWDGKVLLGYVVVFPLVFAWTVAACRAGRQGAPLAAVGVGACLLALLLDPDGFQDRSVYFTLNLLCVCLLAAHALQVGRERRERQQALLRSARLEGELLRRSLQPHFLMNTLTALSEWIEQEPRVAVRMIGSLAEELRLLSRVSGETLITMHEELRLCQSHLAVMSRRRDREFRLRTEGVDPGAATPPAIFHTLVENAITHCAYPEAEVEFVLRASPVDGATRYVFEAPLSDAAGSGNAREGTGTHYIRARLQESFGDSWSFTAGPSAGVWRTTILMPAPRRV